MWKNVCSFFNVGVEPLTFTPKIWCRLVTKDEPTTGSLLSRFFETRCFLVLLRKTLWDHCQFPCLCKVISCGCGHKDVLHFPARHILSIMNFFGVNPLSLLFFRRLFSYLQQILLLLTMDARKVLFQLSNFIFIYSLDI